MLDVLIDIHGEHLVRLNTQMAASETFASHLVLTARRTVHARGYLKSLKRLGIVRVHAMVLETVWATRPYSSQSSRVGEGKFSRRLSCIIVL
jgi:hypothetical protein